ncbi:expressed unknown protein [Seminavis robusta]|uniref:Uncharacterized protein n=1 Tax=Seminavis robusta TaxID=568900 RepID=A0A9N8E1F5_9STRA|nr:expressed unknown protein [Seminavis robusta]|eukprot:Sro525_g160140.1 n/a (295) ;mRNA; f:29582-30466
MSSCAKTVESVLKLNTKGTKLLQSKKYSKAITAFSSCLTKVKDLLATHDHDDDDDLEDEFDDLFSTTSSPAEELSRYSFAFRFLPNTPDSNHMSSSSFTDDDTVATTEPQEQEEQEEATTPSNDHSFQSPILIVLDDVRGSRRRSRSSSSSSSSFDQKPMVKLSFAILYNLAISFHLSALAAQHTKKNDDRQHRRLQKALTLYQTAYNLIHQEHKKQECMVVGVMESMALLNNLGHVHWLLDQRQEAQACFEEMLGSVVWVTHCGDQKRVFQFDLFFHNALSHVLQPKQSAAAA